MKFDYNSEKFILKYDERIAEIEKEIDIFKYINPINSKEEKGKFLSEYEAGNYYNPQFKYEKFNPNIDELYDELSVIKKNFENDDGSILAPYYLKNIEKTMLKIDLFKDRTAPNFGEEISNLYGKPSNRLLKEAKSNLLKYKSVDEYEETLTPKEVLEIFKIEMEKYGFKWNFEILSSASAKLSVNASLNKIKINASEKFSENNIKKYIYHEIKTHVFRAENGKMQPFLIFKNGFPDYISTEEGLALNIEDRNGLLKPIDIKRYSARVIAANYSTKSSFYDVFDKLINYFPPAVAFTIVQRVKRGIIDTGIPGGYTKDFVYMDGFQKVGSFLKEGNSIEILFTGKIGLDDVDLVQELINQGILMKPKYLPFNNIT